MTEGSMDKTSLPRPCTPPAVSAVSSVGIQRMAVYIPRTAVAHEDLETFDGVSAGKYTVGLGQLHMSYVTDREDVISLALTALETLVRFSGISYRDIGRLEVGTETIVDKSKSIKSSLMRLFTEAGNAEVEGLDCTNACYGSTAALFNAVNWMESRAWDGRYAVVVAADVAVYAKGAARPTGGAGAVAMLIGEGGPIRFESRLRTTVMGDRYDFYKPRVDSEYPTVNGQETVDTYVEALDMCYSRYCKRAEKQDGEEFNAMKSTDYCVFHSPFHKMVQKSYARLVFNDFLRTEAGTSRMYRTVEKYREMERGKVHRDGEAVRAFVRVAGESYEEKCKPGAWLCREVGNSYTASVYSSLGALVCEEGDEMEGKRILMYAFGSGFAASMFSLRVTGSVRQVLVGRGIQESLDRRVITSADVYDRAMRQREVDYGRFGYCPRADVGALFGGTFYLTEVSAEGERRYAQVAWESDAENAS